MKKRPHIKRLKKALSYDPIDGSIRWLACHSSLRVGCIAGWIGGAHPYRRVTVLGHTLLAHHIAWAIHYGRWPTAIDHINGDGCDNRIVNLRECSQHKNSQNIRKAKVNSLTQVLGVWKHPNGRFRATICENGKSRHIGYYATAEEAHVAYIIKKREIHSGCTI